MLFDLQTRPSAVCSSRHDTAGHLREALQELAQHQARIASHQERSWASVTFAGTRHRLDLWFDGAEAVEAGEQFIAALPDHEFAIPGQLVADAEVTEMSHTLLPRSRLAVALEMLLLNDA